ncbi:MAG: MFS transporter [Acidimicrobiia bacterium]
MALPRSFAPLRHRQFAGLWTGAFFSNIGTWMEAVAVGILVTEVTHQAVWAAIVAAAGFVPNAIIGPFGGALADRVPRRRLLLGTTAVQTTLAGVLTALAALDATEPWAVTLIVLASGCAGALGFPSYQSMMPDLVPREELTAAAALGAAQWNLGRVVGPALAGAVIAAGGYEWAFAINTVSFLAVIAAVAPLKLPAPTPKAGESIPRAIKDGILFSVREPGIRAVMVYVGLNSLLAAPFIGLVAPMAKVVTGHARDASVLVTTQGVGAVLMALLLGGLAARFGNRHVVLTAVTALPVALVLYAFAPSLALSAAAIFAVGFLYLGCLSSFTSIAQLRASPEFRGRVMSALMVLLGTLYPLGLLIQGALADEIGLRATTAGAAVILAITVAATRAMNPGFDRELGDIAPRADTAPIAATE